MKENFQNAYNAMMKLSNSAQVNADVYTAGSELRYTWQEKAACYKFCATALMTACTNSGILLDTESNLHPVFDKIMKNLY